jgi:hypothetical protein
LHYALRIARRGGRDNPAKSRLVLGSLRLRHSLCDYGVSMKVLFHKPKYLRSR